MNIEIPITVGYKFWVARGKKEYTTISFIDDADNSWTRTEIKWVPYVKEKEVIEVEITITDRIVIKYLAQDVEKTNIMYYYPTMYYDIEEIMMFWDKETALKCAEELATDKINRKTMENPHD